MQHEEGQDGHVQRIGGQTSNKPSQNTIGPRPRRSGAVARLSDDQLNVMKEGRPGARNNARLVLELGTEIKACVEMMSGAVWVIDRLQAAGWKVQIADPRKVRAVAPLACKTDKVDARAIRARRSRPGARAVDPSAG
jgi:transposase